MCVTGSLISTIAYSEELPSDASTSIAAGGWWKPEKAESATTRQLVISMADLTHFKGSHSLRTSRDKPNSDREIEPIVATLVSLPHYGPTHGSVAKAGFFADLVPLLPASSSRSGNPNTRRRS
jgi:hypothetical protein